ncbi:MAG: TIGR03620 family F420-dependent LLM class oxidoreductase [Actinomycetota bacterium]
MRLDSPVVALGRVGVFGWPFVTAPATEVRAAARRVEAAGYGAVWFPESRGREAFTTASLLLEATKTITTATGIASIWARDPMAMAIGGMSLAESSGGRFVLGIGVSHAPSAEARGHHYERPLERMTEYLDAMAQVANPLAGDPAPPPVVLAALGPRMLRLAATRTAGAHPYFVPVEHTTIARGVLGPGPLLAPEQAAVIDTDPGRARAVARQHMSRYLAADNYRRNLLRLGWSEADLGDGGSDALVDAIVAWGDADAVAGRVREHLDRGADHVSVLMLGEDWVGDLERLASVLW